MNLILAPGDPSSGRRKNSSPVPKPSGSPAAYPQAGKPLLFIRPSTTDSAFQACIDQFEIKDGNRLRDGPQLTNNTAHNVTRYDLAMRQVFMAGPENDLDALFPLEIETV